MFKGNIEFPLTSPQVYLVVKISIRKVINIAALITFIMLFAVTVPHSFFLNPHLICGSDRGIKMSPVFWQAQSSGFWKKRRKS